MRAGRRQAGASGGRGESSSADIWRAGRQAVQGTSASEQVQGVGKLGGDSPLRPCRGPLPSPHLRHTIPPGDAGSGDGAAGGREGERDQDRVLDPRWVSGEARGLRPRTLRSGGRGKEPATPSPAGVPCPRRAGGRRGRAYDPHLVVGVPSSSGTTSTSPTQLSSTTCPHGSTSMASFVRESPRPRPLVPLLPAPLGLVEDGMLGTEPPRDRPGNREGETAGRQARRNSRFGNE